MGRPWRCSNCSDQVCGCLAARDPRGSWVLAQWSLRDGKKFMRAKSKIMYLVVWNPVKIFSRNFTDICLLLLLSAGPRKSSSNQKCLNVNKCQAWSLIADTTWQKQVIIDTLQLHVGIIQKTAICLFYFTCTLGLLQSIPRREPCFTLSEYLTRAGACGGFQFATGY